MSSRLDERDIIRCRWLAVDDGHVYWGNACSMQLRCRLYRVPKAGGPVAVIGEYFYPASIAVDATTIYVAAEYISSPQFAVIALPK